MLLLIANFKDTVERRMDLSQAQVCKCLLADGWDYFVTYNAKTHGLTKKIDGERFIFAVGPQMFTLHQVDDSEDGKLLWCAGNGEFDVDVLECRIVATRVGVDVKLQPTKVARCVGCGYELSEADRIVSNKCPVCGCGTLDETEEEWPNKSCSTCAYGDIPMDSDPCPDCDHEYNEWTPKKEADHETTT